MKAITTALLLLILSLAMSAEALLRYVPLTELCEKAEAIVIADVKKLEYQQLPETGEMWTIVHLEVQQRLKYAGKPRASYQIRVMGGKTPDGGRQLVPDSPVYQEGERVIAFLIPHPDFPGHYHTLGWKQGKFTVKDKDFLKERQESLKEFLEKIGGILAEASARVENKGE